ncbi:MAG TPA: DUF996 domain-containing protein [Gammaproteobacteria bacterium]|nr:DUF996 domain-containing protein [Gammaproteobacteria bacterium]
MDKTTKLLGGWGYIGVIVFGLFGGFLGPVAILSLVGAIIVVISYVRAAGEYNRPEIRTNAIVALIIAIVSVIVFIFMVGASIFSLLFHAGEASIAAFGGSLIAGVLITWLLAIVASWFWFRASASLGAASGQNLFKVGGLLIFIGAITIVVFGIGGIVSLIGEILITVAFFATPEKSGAQVVVASDSAPSV